MTPSFSDVSGDLIVLGDPRLQTDADIQAMAFAADGTLLTVEESGTLRRWNVETGEQIDWLALVGPESLWAFAPHARALASASDEVSVWETSTGQMLASVSSQAWVSALALLPDTGFAATGHDDGSVAYWDVVCQNNTAKRARHHQLAISAIAVTLDGALMAVASEDKSISLWDLRAGKVLADLHGHQDRISALAWHPSGRFLVSAGWDSSARQWDAVTREQAMIFNGHAQQVVAIAFSPDGRLLATADSEPAVRVWDFETRKVLRTFRRLPADVRSLAFSPDSRLLAWHSERQIQIRDARTGRPIVTPAMDPRSKTSVFAPAEADVFISNGGGAGVRVWNGIDRKNLLSFDSAEPVHDVVASDNGSRLFAACGQSIRVYSAAGDLAVEWKGPDESITTLAISRDGSLLASASRTGLDVWLWRTTDGEPVLLIPDALEGCVVECLAFHPTEPLLAVAGVDHLATGGSSGALSVWDIEKRLEKSVFLDGTTAVAFSADGRRLVSADLDAQVVIRDLETETELVRMLGHDGGVTCIAIGPDDCWFATGGDDFTVRFWSFAGEELAVRETPNQVTSLSCDRAGARLIVGHANGACSILSVPVEVRERRTDSAESR